MLEECEKCEGRSGSICDCRCGRPCNSGHPLSPCRDCDDEEGEPECMTDDDYIMEGNRCITYCSWLHRIKEKNCERTGHDLKVSERFGEEIVLICDMCGAWYVARPLTEDDVERFKAIRKQNERRCSMDRKQVPECKEDEHDYVPTGDDGDNEIELRCTICGRYKYIPWPPED